MTHVTDTPEPEAPEVDSAAIRAVEDAQPSREVHALADQRKQDDDDDATRKQAYGKSPEAR